MISLVPSESWGSLSGCGLLPENGVRGYAPPGAFGRAAASPQTRQMRCWPSAAQATYHSFPPLPPTKTRSLRCVTVVLALCGLNLPSSGTHTTPAFNRAHSGSHAETRRVLRVDGDDVFGSEIIDTIGPFQADQTVTVALAEGHRNAVSP